MQVGKVGVQVGKVRVQVGEVGVQIGPEVLAHGDIYNGVDDGVHKGQQEEDDPIIEDRVGEL